jgi:hypothetical protein
MEMIIGLLVGAVGTLFGIVVAFKRRKEKPEGKSAKFIAMLGG